MRYISTRGGAPAISFLDAVLAGMAPDGGLYTPESWPSVAGFSAPLRFADTAADVLAAFAGTDLTEIEINGIVTRAYGEAFANPAIAPLRQIGDESWLLELFHGPSLAFKDIAMRMLAQLYDVALSKRNQRRTIVCATSGDTGGAAVEALKGQERIDLFVLLPSGRVSDVQRRFMTAADADNVFPIALEADFDDCQTIVKALFADASFSERAQLSPVNSINWARITAQATYYITSAHMLSSGGTVSFVVPTGNFGNAFAGCVAKSMGAPIGTILAATNVNDVLVAALEQGQYRRSAKSVATLSPAMDIQAASNFERLVFEALGRNGEATRNAYAQFAQSGGFQLPTEAVTEIRKTLRATSVEDEHTQAMMKSALETRGELVCPHTAVGLAAMVSLPLGGQVVALATAHPAKFPDTVERAAGVRPPLPARCEDLLSRVEKFEPLPADVETVKRYIRERSRAWI